MAALIGPNAVLQLIPLIEPGFLARLGMEPPSDHGLMPEEPAHRLHAAVRDLPQAPAILAEAGLRTGDYILAHRIPRPAQRLLRILPQGLAVRVLSQAIARNAWTFAGSGAFAVTAPGRFRLVGNPLIKGEISDRPLCHWHVAVFDRLFQSLVSPKLHFQETACTACGDPACVFDLSPPGQSR